MWTSGSRRSPSASASALTSRSTPLNSPAGKHGAKISSTARSRRVATRMSCTRSMSSVSSTPSACSNSSSRARARCARRRARYGSSGVDGMSRALAMAGVMSLRPRRARGSRPRAGRRARSCSGWPSAPRPRRAAGCPPGAAARARGAAPAARATSSAGAAAHAERALERGGVEHGADQPGSDVALPPTASAASARRDLEAREGRARGAHGGELGPRRRVGAQVGGQRARADRERGAHVTPPAMVPTASSDEPPPTSTTATAPVGRRAERAVAPTNASRASSSPVSTRSDLDARALAHRRRSASRFARGGSRPSPRRARAAPCSTAATSRLPGDDVRDRGDLVGGIAVGGEARPSA